MDRTRRAFLAALGASVGVSECLARAPAVDAQYRASVSIVEPADAPLEYDVMLPNATATKHTPIRLHGTYTNPSDQPEPLSVIPKRAQKEESDQHSPGIILVDPSMNLEQADPGCWMPEADSVPALLGMPRYELPAGETVTVEYELWADPQGKPEHKCLIPTTYRIDDLAGWVTLDITIQEG